jgi:serine/threonine-protein kinase
MIEVSLQAGRIVGEFWRLRSRLGEEGTSRFWDAEDLRAGVRVVIEFTPIDVSDPQARLRFAREARVVMSFRSPYVVRTFHRGLIDNFRAFSVIERLEGEDLERVLARESAFRLIEAAQIMDYACRGTSRLDAAGIAHREVEPNRVFMTLDRGGTRVVKLLTVGFREGTNDREPEFARSPYVSPERANSASGPVDPRADVWAVGVMAYRMLTGELPFEADAAGGQARVLDSGRLARVRARRPELELPNALDEWFRMAIHVDPEQRFPNVEQAGLAFGHLARTFLSSDGRLRRVNAMAVPADASSTASSTVEPRKTPPALPDRDPTVACEPPRAMRERRRAVIDGDYEVVVGEAASGISDHVVAVLDDEELAQLADQAESAARNEPAPPRVPPTRTEHVAVSGREVAVVVDAEVVNVTLNGASLRTLPVKLEQEGLDSSRAPTRPLRVRVAPPDRDGAVIALHRADASRRSRSRWWRTSAVLALAFGLITGFVLRRSISNGARNPASAIEQTALAPARVRADLEPSAPQPAAAAVPAVVAAVAEPSQPVLVPAPATPIESSKKSLPPTASSVGKRNLTPRAPQTSRLTSIRTSDMSQIETLPPRAQSANLTSEPNESGVPDPAPTTAAPIFVYRGF